MLFFKKLMARYGVIFFFSFAAGFVLLATIRGNSDPSLLIPGDFIIRISTVTLYMPFGSAISLGLLATIGFEIYRYFKK